MKILSLFSVSKEEKELKEQKRIGRALKRGQEALLDKLEKRKDDAQDTIDKLVHGDINKINTDTFNETYHKAKVDLMLVTKELEIAREVQKDLYTEDSNDTSEE